MRLARVGLALTFLCSIAVLAEAKSYSARRFDSDVRVESGGTLQVTETVVFTFVTGTFDHVFREIPTRRTDGVEIVSGSMDGRDFPIGSGVDHLDVSGRSRIRATWRFVPASDSSHTFTLIYRVRGVVQQSASGDLLEWRGIPSERAYRIDEASVTLRVPAAVEDRDGANLKPHVRAHRVENPIVDWRRDPSGAELIIQATGQQIGPNGWLETSVSFPRASIIAAPPQWQERRLAADRLAPRWMLGSLAVGVGGLVLLFGMRQQYDAPSRDVRAVAPAFAPPDDLPPHLAGALASNGQSSLEHAMAALVRLADRGELTIVEDRHRVFGVRSFVVRRTPRGTAQTNAERVLLDTIFATDSHDGVPLSSARRRLVRRFRAFATTVQQELREAGVVDEDRGRVRRRYGHVAIGLIVLASAACIAGGFLVPTFGGWPMLIPAALIAVGLISLIVSAASTPLTNEGLRRGAAWRSFGRHLRNVAHDRERLTVASPNEVLAYAIALRLAGPWSKFMRRHPSGLPDWFRALSNLRDGDAFAAFIATGGAGHGHGGSAGAGAAAGGGASGAG